LATIFSENQGHQHRYLDRYLLKIWAYCLMNNVDRSAALYDPFILMLVTVVLALQAGKAVVQISAP
jgi:hypothetical protein